MAKLFDMATAQVDRYEQWKKTRPEDHHALLNRFQQNYIYKHKETNQIGLVCRVESQNAVTLLVPRRLNDDKIPTLMVHGINPDDLEDADLPEGVTLMSYEEAGVFVLE